MQAQNRSVTAWSTRLLAAIGGVALVYAIGAAIVHASGNSAPDSLHDIVSPNGHYRMVVTEMLVGFPGQVCIKDVYVLLPGQALVRTDEDDHIYAGACDGLRDIQWLGNDIEGDLNLVAAFDGVTGVRLHGHALRGAVRVNWQRAVPAIAIPALPVVPGLH